MQTSRVDRSSPNSSAVDGAAPVAAWRPVAAGAVIVAGGLGALIYGVARGELVYVLGAIGLTLLLAGLVDGRGPRYRGAGVALLSVFVSAKLLDRLPDSFRRGVVYGALMALFGVYVMAKEWPRYRASAAGDGRSTQLGADDRPRHTAAPGPPSEADSAPAPL